MAHIVMSAPLGLAGAHRQQWLATVERLNLRFFHRRNWRG